MCGNLSHILCLLVPSCALLSLVVVGETLFTESVTAPSLRMKYVIETQTERDDVGFANTVSVLYVYMQFCYICI